MCASQISSFGTIFAKISIGFLLRLLNGANVAKQKARWIFLQQRILSSNSRIHAKAVRQATRFLYKKGLPPKAFCRATEAEAASPRQKSWKLWTKTASVICVTCNQPLHFLSICKPEHYFINAISSCNSLMVRGGLWATFCSHCCCFREAHPKVL